MTRTLLVVEDDPGARALASATFADGDWEVLEAESANQAEVVLGYRDDVDVVLLDVGLPGTSGLDLLGQLRSSGDRDLPVLIVSGLTATVDRVVGLRMGADDYLTKPIDPTELRARVDAVLRRATRATAPRLAKLEFGDLIVWPEAREVTVHGVQVSLTPREFDLLSFLSQHPRQVFTRSQLLRQVWTSSSEWQTTATVTEHIRKLREKLRTTDEPCRWITTLRGVGYRFDP